MKADRTEADLVEPTFAVKSGMQRFLDEKGHEDTKTGVVTTSEKLNSKMFEIYQKIGECKLAQQLALKEDYTNEYIKASNDYTE